MARSTPRYTPTRVLALLLLGAATVSSGVFAAPTTASMNSGLSSTGVARPEGLQSRSSPEQGSLLDVQRRGVEDVNLVPRADEECISIYETTTTWLAVPREERAYIYTQLRLARRYLDRLLGSASNSPQSLFESNKPRLEAIVRNAEKAMDSGVRGPMLVLAEQIHADALKFYPEESDEKSVAERNVACARARSHATAQTTITSSA
ncbi:hypothetical protein FB446DRAFT_820358 [Lentinula raphanica]|nr:hypothetical protein FB446DRAFT_820358 [Lentinula raphanica]